MDIISSGWQRRRLNLSSTMSGVSCSIVHAHPWVYGLGQETENGAYLSPVNAIRYLSEKLASAATEQHVIIFMITGNNHTEFMQQLGDMAAVFPAAGFIQVKRLAQSAMQLAAEKMQIPAVPGMTLPTAVPLSVPTTRAAITAKLIAEAQQAAGISESIEGLKSSLATFIQQRDSVIAAAVAGMDELQERSATAWVFTGVGNITTTLFELVKDIPHPFAPLSVAMMMVGDNLDDIAGMIHEI